MSDAHQGYGFPLEALLRLILKQELLHLEELALILIVE